MEEGEAGKKSGKTFGELSDGRPVRGRYAFGSEEEEKKSPGDNRERQSPQAPANEGASRGNTSLTRGNWGREGSLKKKGELRK